MAKGTFFTSWQLWEEMTFVLAMGIVIVFFVGLIKLWVANRHMRKFEQLDEEKQARIAQMRKSGISASRRARLGSGIPFGVKALESGVEVEGVWVARMASMASRPPDRKWSSRRKIRPPPASPAGIGELGSSRTHSNKRARRGSRGSSRRSGKISRREIVEPSQQTREKLEDLSLLEEEERPSGEGWSGRDKSTAAEENHNHNSHHNSQQTQPDTSQVGGHVGALGRIQRGLKKMTSSDTWREQARRQRQEGRRLDAKQFHEGAQAKKPQRFYPGQDSAATATTTTTTPLVAPQARSHATRQRVNSLLSAHGATEVPVSHHLIHRRAERDGSDQQAFTIRRSGEIGQQTSNDTPDTSAESFVTSVEVPLAPSPPSQTPAQERTPSRGRDGASMAPTQPYSVPRRSSSLQRTSSRRKSSEGKGSRDRGVGAVHGEPSSAVPAQRYPPNSSRSGPVVHTRTHSGGSLQEPHKQQPRTASTTPSPTSSFRDAYANTSKRKVNANFEILPAGTFSFSDQQQQQQHDAMPRSEPASSAASGRSSFDSQSSSARRKLQKKRKSQS